jgi:hypothetical protein
VPFFHTRIFKNDLSRCSVFPTVSSRTPVVKSATVPYWISCTVWTSFRRRIFSAGILLFSAALIFLSTRYKLEGPWIESRWGEIFRTYPDRLRGPPSLLYNGYRVFPGGKRGWGVMLTTHPLLVQRLRKSWAIPPLTLWVLLGLLRGSIYLHLTFLQST